MRLVRSSLLLAILLLVVAACGDGEGTETTTGATDTTTQASQNIEGSPWRLVEARGFEVPPAISVTIQFQDGKVTGASTCNRFNGPYELDGTSLTIGQLAMTQKACPDRLTRSGDRPHSCCWVGLLPTASTVPGSNCSTPTNSRSSPIARSAPPTCGERWEVTGLLNRQKEAFATPIQGTKMTANFTKGGELAGNAGCNQYSTTYEVDGNTISIPEPTLTRKACQQPKGLMGQENRYLTALTEAVTWEIDGP